MTTESTPRSASADVRMRGFTHRTTMSKALAWLEPQLAWLPSEPISLAAAAGRVLARDVQSKVDVPMFERAMMDGFALRAADVSSASSQHPTPLLVVGEVLPGRTFSGQVAAGQAVRIMTGAPMPHGADAVLPFEKVRADSNRIDALDQIAQGKNVGRRGEDIGAQTTVLQRGRRLRPQDMGVLSSIGAAEIEVVCQPRVRIVTTGNELLPPGSMPEGVRIVDANSPMLHSLVTRDGGIPINPGIVADDPTAILAALHDEADVILVSGGSSVGREDHVPTLVAEHGELAVHGIAMRPASPTGLGRLGRRLVFLLPGNPVSCLCAYDFFAGRTIRALGGRNRQWPYRRITLPLRRKLASPRGRLDYARVRLVDEGIEPLAVSGASVLSSTSRADGFVIIPDHSEGYTPGQHVHAYLYDEEIVRKQPMLSD